jgi:outer membrane receptor protein involved in Fe transport
MRDRQGRRFRSRATRRCWACPVMWIAAWALSAGVSAVQASAPAAQEMPAARKMPDDAERVLEEVIVRADASLAARLGNLGSRSTLDGSEIAAVGGTHASEILARVPGVWVPRGSGQEHLTAIRSPVYAGLGACGEFLYLEDGVPLRPAGFCNINNLFELNLEQAGAIEVWRGPASALLGGNALRGAINALTPSPEAPRLTLEGGGWDFYRAAFETALDLGEQRVSLAANAVDTGGWRDRTGYDQQKLSLAHDLRVGAFDVRNTLNVTRLNQQTGTFVSGFEAYKDRDLSETNASPNSYRDAWSARLASHWSAAGVRITPYLRRSHMSFLQHFIPGEPWEKNGQTSAGVLGSRSWEGDELRLELGAQAEWMEAFIEEFQEAPLTTSSAFNNAVRPAGVHYDFRVDGRQFAGYYDVVWSLRDDLRLIHSGRAETLRYDYDNLAADGNSRDDGTRCGFGGCLYNRPADREDSFSDLSGRIGLEWDVSSVATVYGVVASGFRPPQVNELYRLQRGQDVANLDSERILAVEIGYRRPGWELAAFADEARNFIFRDAAGLNVSDGRTRSKGIELSIFRALTIAATQHELEANVTWAEHTYDFDGGATGGETIRSGDFVDTAPRWLGSARWRFSPTERIESELEFVLQGEHFVNADNTARYDGHELFNWRLRLMLAPNTEVFLRVVNLLDTEYAERADFAAFDPLRYRYFPGMPRHGFVGVTHAW